MKMLPHRCQTQPFEQLSCPQQTDTLLALIVHQLWLLLGQKIKHEKAFELLGLHIGEHINNFPQNLVRDHLQVQFS